MFLCMAWAAVDARATERYSACLPTGVNLDSTVVVDASASSKPPKSRLTVRDKLRQLNARCKRGKLVDNRGRQIQFYTLIGCWGNPPADYEEQLRHQNAELQRLERKYTVVRISCLSGDPRLIQ